MRFFNKLTMAVAAIFFAVSFSSPVTAGNAAKVYQVCKKWRVDQGGWMPTEMMQHCRNVLAAIVDEQCYDNTQGTCQESVDVHARNDAKYCLYGYLPEIYCPDGYGG